MSDYIEYSCPSLDCVYRSTRPSRSRISVESLEGRAKKGIDSLKRRVCSSRIPSFRRDINSR